MYFESPLFLIGLDENAKNIEPSIAKGSEGYKGLGYLLRER